ncbi:MAG: VCBS repeat-containing protein [Phycisphaerales bacterium]|nr:VCBS repeat-containing protein [Planctomycetota bacterium]MCH8509275.1 VCBS repeat-containing protein [Phycisphaerales bacterium]
MRVSCAIVLVAGCVGVGGVAGADPGEPLFSGLGFYTQERVRGVWVGDLNGDGTPEVVCQEGDFRIATFRRVGGRYERLSTLESVDEITSFVVADMDNDGRPDLVLSTATGFRVTIWWNGGDGVFPSGSPRVIGGSNDTRSVAVADLNGNGLLDLICSVTFADKMHFIRNNGGRSFSAFGSSNAGAAPGAVVSGAFRGPGTADFAIVARDDEAVEYHRVTTTTSGSFRSVRTPYPIGAAPGSLFVADLDGDGFDDLLVPGVDQAVVWVLMGSADGLGPPAAAPVSLSPTRVGAMDLDGDGRPSIVAVDRNATRFAVLDQDAGGFAPERLLEIAFRTDALAFGDVSGDGLADMVFGTEFDFVGTMAGDGAGGFVVRDSIGVEPDTSDFLYEFDLADLNGDGVPDLLVLDYDLNRLSVSLASAPGVFGAPTHYATSANPFTMVVADLTMNGHADVVVSHFNNDVVHLYQGVGGGALNPVPRTFTLGGFGYQVAAADMNGSGSPDLVALAAIQNRLNISFNDGAGNFAMPQVSVPLSAPGLEQPVAMVIHDFDQDGDLDIAVISQFGTTLRIVRNEGASGFAVRNAITLPGEAGSIVVTDFDEDGDADLVLLGSATASGFGGLQVIIQRDDAPGFFLTGPRIPLPLGGSYRGLLLADLDGDGIEDLVTGCARTASLVMLRGTDPGFGAPTPFFAGRVVTVPRAVDLDEDGDLDLVWAVIPGGEIGVLRNTRLSPVQPCPADLTGDGVVNFFDLSEFMALFNAQDPAADLAPPFGVWNFFDVSAYLALYNEGCP